MMFATPRLLSTLVLLALLSGCGKDKVADGDKSKPADGAPTDGGPPPAAKDSVYKLTVADLAEEEKKDRAGTQKKYAGKTLELSGVVEFPIIDIGDDKQPATFTLSFLKPGGGFGSFSVNCMCSDRSVYGTLGRGQSLRVRGVYHEFASALKSCEVVEKGPETLVRVTAEQLAADFTANFDEALKKYDGKTLVLTGTVTKIKPHAEGLKINCLELKGDGKTMVECRYNKPEVVDQYKVGDSVKLVSSMLLSGGGTLNIALCYPLPK